uniref:Uncharacterized protein n=1 Tax=Arundo donax TaxID=35708 RepID=A0A0A9FJG0_ARUDO
MLYPWTMTTNQHSYGKNNHKFIPCLSLSAYGVLLQ